MKPIALLVVATLAAAIGAARADEPGPDPLSVVQALMDAESETDLELALSLFADDAVIVNIAGARTAGAQLKRFLEADMWLHESFVLEQTTVERNRVTWSKPVTAGFYQDIGVAPVRFAFSAEVRNGKIQSIVAHVPPDEIARIESACRRRTPEPLIYGGPCSEFVLFIRAETAFATGAAAYDHVETRTD
jgi:hypothetical protein